MVLGDDFAEGDQPSTAKLNNRSIGVLDGAAINAYVNTAPTKVFLALSDDGSIKANNLYVRSADGLQTLNASMSKHTHAADTDLEGGDLLNILTGYSSLFPIYLPAPTKYDFFAEQLGTGSQLDDVIASTQQYVSVHTGASPAANDYASAIKGGVMISFASKILYVTKMQINLNTNLLWRTGINMERANVANTGVVKKFGLEGCSGTGIYVQVVTCDGGGTRTQTNTGSDMAQGAMRGYKLVFTPATSVVYTDSMSNINTVTTSIPSSGASYGDTAFIASMKTTNTTQKAIYLAGLTVIGKINDPAWVS
jgi:hypothetical protein